MSRTNAYIYTSDDKKFKIAIPLGYVGDSNRLLLDVVELKNNKLVFAKLPALPAGVTSRRLESGLSPSVRRTSYYYDIPAALSGLVGSFLRHHKPFSEKEAKVRHQSGIKIRKYWCFAVDSTEDRIKLNIINY